MNIIKASALPSACTYTARTCIHRYGTVYHYILLYDICKCNCECTQLREKKPTIVLKDRVTRWNQCGKGQLRISNQCANEQCANALNKTADTSKFSICVWSFAATCNNNYYASVDFVYLDTVCFALRLFAYCLSAKQRLFVGRKHSTDNILSTIKIFAQSKATVSLLLIGPTKCTSWWIWRGLSMESNRLCPTWKWYVRMFWLPASERNRE